MRMRLPELPYEAWKDTYATLHMWTQIVGKVRLELSPHVNHWWEVPLYLSARGLTTSPIPYLDGVFDVEFDFIDHMLLIRTSAGATRTIPLAPRSVADFYAAFMAALRSLGIDVTIYPVPVEIADPIPFDQDTTHASYDADYANRFWQALTFSDRVLKEFRGRFIGKHSPVHFFWGGFDIASTRFSGRPAPAREWAPELAAIMRDAYSHEVSSAGFWAGGAGQDAAFYAYHTPEPGGYRDAVVQPDAAFYSTTLGEYLLPYEAVRRSPTPEADVLAFLQSTYEAGASLAVWDRAALERD
ncbi:MAG: hypothetical protein IT319_00095 [Anaerolineae bacterium]|nr:hypothetical protein [Anaerolineae bacterium]